MTVKTIRPAQNFTTVTDRNPSPAVWSDCPWDAIQEGAVAGITFFDDFDAFPVAAAATEGNWGRYAAYGSASASANMASGTSQGGEVVLSSDAADEGAGLRSLATPFRISRASKQLWFEARVKTNSIADLISGWFVGLMENAALSATVPITAAGAIADQNLVGFIRLEGDGDMVDTVYRANTVPAVTVQADAVTLVADTYVKLGMVYRPNEDPLATSAGTNNKYLLTFYANNARLSSYKQIPSADGTDFPNDVSLGICLAILEAATPGSVTCDWIRAAQLL
jgi:hypothetical protein